MNHLLSVLLPKKLVTRPLFNIFCVVVLITYGMVVGCKATGQYFQSAELSDKTKVIVYLYRPHQIGGAVSYPVFANNHFVTKLDDGGYFHMLALRGELLFRFLRLKKGR